MSMHQFKGLLINIAYSEVQEIWDHVQMPMHQFTGLLINITYSEVHEIWDHV